MAEDQQNQQVAEEQAQQGQEQPEQAQENEQELSDLDQRHQKAVQDLHDRLEAEGVELVDVDYDGEPGVYNYDIAPYNIVKDEATDYVGQSSVLQPGETYSVPSDLVENLLLTQGFSKSEEGDENAGGEEEQIQAPAAQPEEQPDPNVQVQENQPQEQPQAQPQVPAADAPVEEQPVAQPAEESQPAGDAEAPQQNQ